VGPIAALAGVLICAAVWGFQVQQLMEKTLKAWLHLLEQDPPYTHDLGALVKLLERAGVDISAYRELAR
jgi:HEPN domain-containing protein